MKNPITLTEFSVLQAAKAKAIFASSLSVAGEVGKEGKLDYEFKNFENLIRKALGTSSRPSCKRVTPGNLILAISNEREQLEHCFDIKFLNHTSENERKTFIRVHQFSLSRLINSTYDTFKQVNVKRRSWGSIIENIESLFQFLATRYFQYLDLSYDAPNGFIEHTLAQQEEQQSELENFLNQFVGDGELKVLIRKLASLSTVEAQKSLGEIFFIVQVRQQLIELFRRCDHSGANVDDEIRNELLRVNFNSREFFNHYTRNIAEKLVKLDSDRERFELLAWYLKVINQIQPNDSISFSQDQATIKQSISEWIAEEMNFIEAKFRLSPMAIGKSPELALGDFKLTLDLSVAQLALLTKSFVETGVIQNKNISELIRFLSRFAVTKKSGSVSQESLRIKYYNVETGTKESIRNMLHTAIGYINKN